MQKRSLTEPQNSPYNSRQHTRKNANIGTTLCNRPYSSTVYLSDWRSLLKGVRVSLVSKVFSLVFEINTPFESTTDQLQPLKNTRSSKRCLTSETNHATQNTGKTWYLTNRLQVQQTSNTLQIYATDTASVKNTTTQPASSTLNVQDAYKNHSDYQYNYCILTSGVSLWTLVPNLKSVALIVFFSY